MVGPPWRPTSWGRFLLTTVIFMFNDTATTEIYTLSLHDALPISMLGMSSSRIAGTSCIWTSRIDLRGRSEEHTSELQSLTNLVCRLLLEKKKQNSPHKTSHSSAVAQVKLNVAESPSTRGRPSGTR